ncbi:hypothetical protein [Pseudooceanicola nanhaiensis]|uniref:hypothetical protein n=1 Tax=Pseudooceanicola nanhaiensis TaxID=375761 RepID=UPI001CD2E907|nr:hypothetical protein [Pseudooceanicola nanhaiensis]MCA0920041.1 hypothetical protein [Pseudooceanicola nanhaiensis]
MPVTYQIFPRRDLVYVRFSGFVRPEDSMAALADFMNDPDGHPEIRQLIDLSAVTGFEAQHVEVMKVHARKVDVFRPSPNATPLVYICPGQIALKMVSMILRSWDGIPGMLHRVVQTEEQALELLGMPERSVAELVEQPV